MGRILCCAINICFVVAVLVQLLATLVRGQDESSCIAYGAPCSGGSELCCFNPVVSCLPNSREQQTCLSPLDLTNLSPSLASAPLYQGLTNATRRLLNLFSGLAAPPSS